VTGDFRGVILFGGDEDQVRAASAIELQTHPQRVENRTSHDDDHDRDAEGPGNLPEHEICNSDTGERPGSVDPACAAPAHGTMTPQEATRMRRWLAAVTIATLFTAPLSADVAITTTTTIEGGMAAMAGGLNPKVITRIKGTRSRTEVEMGAQTFATLGFVFAAGGIGARLCNQGFEAADLSLERTRVDLEQQVAFLDQGAFSECHFIDLAGDPWTNLDRFRCFQAPGEFVPLVDRLFQHLGHADLGCWHRGGGFRGLAASADHHDGQQSQREAQMFE